MAIEWAKKWVEGVGCSMKLARKTPARQTLHHLMKPLVFGNMKLRFAEREGGEKGESGKALSTFWAAVACASFHWSKEVTWPYLSSRGLAICQKKKQAITAEH